MADKARLSIQELEKALVCTGRPTLLSYYVPASDSASKKGKIAIDLSTSVEDTLDLATDSEEQKLIRML